MRAIGLIGILAVAGAATSADALTITTRWVSRVGTVDTVVPTVAGVQTFVGVTGVPTRFRLQFSVVNDGTAPGGLLGWNVGTLDATGGTNTRTNGRLGPYNFSQASTANGNLPLPGGDPWTHLDQIDATLGTQAFVWGCNPDGTPTAMPQALIRGIAPASPSLYEITSIPGTSNYTITAAGNNLAASTWRTIGAADPPDCTDPANTVTITYAPQALPPQQFSALLNIILVPAPGAMALLGLGGLIATRRRRA